MGVAAGNCAVFVANRIIIGAGADNLAVIGLLRKNGLWHHDRDARCASTIRQICKSTFLKVPQREANYVFPLPSFVFHKHIHAHMFARSFVFFFFNSNFLLYFGQQESTAFHRKTVST